MFFQLLSHQNIDKLMMMNDWVNFELTNIDITLFWLPCVAALINKEFEDKTIG